MEDTRPAPGTVAPPGPSTPPSPAGAPPTPRGRPVRGTARLLGPAFVAAIAYVDPGNVAANLSAGAEYGYLLVWVLVAANAMAVVVQYLSAKLGIVTGRSLPQLLGERMSRGPRIAYWAQAEIVAIATDVAEVIGGAIALHLLFGLPLVVGGIITGVVSLVLLAVQQRRGQRTFEFVITGMLVILTIGFCAGLLVTPPDPVAMLGGLVPRFEGTESVLLSASMLGATVMPHAIYLHSALTRDRHRTDEPGTHDPGAASGAEPRRRLLLRATRWDVVLALCVAGTVNIAILLLAAVNLRGVTGTDTIEGAQRVVAEMMGPGIGIAFAVGLLASGLASTSVGAYAGSEIMAGLLHVRVPLLWRRVVTMAPAVLLLATDASPTWLLVMSQVLLSFGIPFALVPLVRLTGDPDLMGGYRNGRVLRVVAWLVAVVIVALNATLLVLMATG